VLVEDRAERRFPDWTMGFADVDGELADVGDVRDLGDVEGYNDVLRAVQGPDGEKSEKFLALLALFGSED